MNNSKDTEDLSEEDMKMLTSGIPQNEKIEKESTLSWDGTNFIARVPKEIAEFLKITEDNRKKKRMLFIVEEKDGEIHHEIKIIDKE